MTARATPPSDPAAAEAIGEIRGQLREVIHTMNNDGQRLEAIARSIAKLDAVPGDIVEIKERLTALETDKHRRDGANNLAMAILKSPTLGWLVGAVTTVWTFVTGRLTL